MSAASYEEISGWFDIAVANGATHMIVVCDDYNLEDYPVYVIPGLDVREEVEKIDNSRMQRVMEVYALHLDKAMQMAERRAFHYDEAPSVIKEDPV